MSRLNYFIASRFPTHRPPNGATEKAARRARRGAAVVELAVLLPLLVFLFLITVDFARVFYFSLTLTNCARAGALYASDPAGMPESPFPNVEAAALADANNISPKPTISSATGVDASGRLYAECTAKYSFATITGFPFIPDDVALTRTVRMFVAASTPNTN
jgi:Flp pilus assembly protein TadG